MIGISRGGGEDEEEEENFLGFGPTRKLNQVLQFIIFKQILCSINFRWGPFGLFLVLVCIRFGSIRFGFGKF